MECTEKSALLESVRGEDTEKIVASTIGEKDKYREPWLTKHRLTSTTDKNHYQHKKSGTFIENLLKSQCGQLLELNTSGGLGNRVT